VHVLDDGICLTCQPIDAVRGRYNPNELRIPGGEHGGEWTQGGGRTKHAVKELLEHANDRQQTPELVERADSVYGGHFAGLSVKVTHAYGGGKSKPDWLTVEGEIHDNAGRKVGNFERLLDRDERGRRLVVHQSLELDEHVRGQGFAEAWNREAEAWYRHNGFEYVELTANIDVGGYAWARAGYTWADDESRREIEGQLRKTMADYVYRVNVTEHDPAKKQQLREQIAATKALLARSEAAHRIEDAPTPYEFSQVGRPAGASGRDATWIGKEAMLGSEWEAVKWL
jgi:hypothetical protein